MGAPFDASRSITSNRCCPSALNSKDTWPPFHISRWTNWHRRRRATCGRSRTRRSRARRRRSWTRLPSPSALRPHRPSTRRRNVRPRRKPLSTASTRRLICIKRRLSADSTVSRMTVTAGRRRLRRGADDGIALPLIPLTLRHPCPIDDNVVLAGRSAR